MLSSFLIKCCTIAVMLLPYLTKLGQEEAPVKIREKFGG